MTASWMVYATCVGALLTLAAIFLERLLRDRMSGTRALWPGTLVIALALPGIVVMIGHNSAGDGLPTIASLRPMSPGLSAVAGPASFASAMRLPAIVPPSANIDRIVRGITIAGPLLLFAVLLIDMVRMARARRRCQPCVLDNVSVLVSPDFGPAIVGVLKPEIVIPAWALALAPDQRALVLAHESEHLATHDSRWLGLAFVAVLIAPWNISLWWVLRRFRLAMEVDCDRRVLQRGYDLEQYGSLLIGIARHSTHHSMLAAAFAERRSMLRARINRMTATAEATAGNRVFHVASGIASVLGAFLLGPSRSIAQHVALGIRRQTTPPNVPFALDTVAPRNVRAILGWIPVPTTGAPSITTRFSRDTVRVGEQVELVTVTWFPRALRDSMRHVPIIKLALLTGPSSPRGSQHQITPLDRNVGGQLYDEYAWWRSVSATGAGLIVSPPARLTYSDPPVSPSFPPAHGERQVVKSAPAMLVVRPQY